MKMKLKVRDEQRVEKDEEPEAVLWLETDVDGHARLIAEMNGTKQIVLNIYPNGEMHHINNFFSDKKNLFRMAKDE